MGGLEMAMIEKKFRLQFPSSTENLAMVRSFLDNIGKQAGMPEGEVAKIQLAVDEACSNVIEHAYGHDQSKEVMVGVSYDDSQLMIAIVDRGRGFDPSTVRPQQLKDLVAERQTGGLGLQLIRSLMDEVRYDIVPGEKNQITMVKYFTNESRPESS
ncbi:MAG TPA: ATP-binding protein [Acidobacteriota bacterium]|nr:ATP-binding protein [Acidobacteriota bacterium]